MLQVENLSFYYYKIHEKQDNFQENFPENFTNSKNSRKNFLRKISRKFLVFFSDKCKDTEHKSIFLCL